MKALLCILGISFALCGCHKTCPDNGTKTSRSYSSDRKVVKQKRVRPSAKQNTNKVTSPHYNP